jgi:hypothetical protein
MWGQAAPGRTPRAARPFLPVWEPDTAAFDFVVSARAASSRLRQRWTMAQPSVFSFRNSGCSVLAFYAGACPELVEGAGDAAAYY